MRRAQATWVALDSPHLDQGQHFHTWPEASIQTIALGRRLVGQSKVETQQRQQWRAADARQRTLVSSRAKVAVETHDLFAFVREA